MLVIVGLVIVFGAVILGYLMEGGVLMVLNQPAEFIVIGGAALGTLLVSTPIGVLKQMLGQIKGLLTGAAGRDVYVDLLQMLYQIFRQVQQSGVMSLESHFENPSSSAILTRYPKFLARHAAVDFLADSMKVLIVGGIAAHDLEALLDEDLKVHHDESLRPSAALTKVGDALPGLGIVAAVLGIVITMAHIDGPASEVGHRVGAALVGTFLGILLSYGLAQPIAQAMEQRLAEESYYCLCIRAGILAIYKGNPPAIAIEFARRSLPHSIRPSFNQCEEFCRSAGSAPQAAAA
jgi:chemotaxis protein MotA